MNFRSHLGSIRSELTRSIRVISDGYLGHRYREVVEHYVTKDNRLQIPEEVATQLVANDKFCHWTADNGTAIDENYPVVIDFSDNLWNLQIAVGDPLLMSEFIQLCVEDFLASEVHFPFKDMIIHVDGIEYPDTTKIHDCIIRIRDVTRNYKVKDGEDIASILEVWMMHSAMCDTATGSKTVPNTNGTDWIYALSSRPTMIELDHNSKVGERQQLTWPQEAIDYMYVPNATVEQKKTLNEYGRTAMMGVICMFHYLYKHQKTSYREVEAPVGLQKKRRKHKKEPYNHYYVSELGDQTKTVYTESKPSGAPRQGTAMHIRRGHWQLWPNHRQLPPKLQKRTWVASSVVGDPRYGIIIRDYNAALVSAETEAILHEAAEEAGEDS